MLTERGDEVDYFEKDQQLYFPAGRNQPLHSSAERAAKREELKWDKMDLQIKEQNRRKVTKPVREDELMPSEKKAASPPTSKKFKASKKKSQSSVKEDLEEL